MVAFNQTSSPWGAEARLIEFFIPPWVPIVYPMFSVPMGPTDDEIEDEIMEELSEDAERATAHMPPKLTRRRA